MYRRISFMVCDAKGIVHQMVCREYPCKPTVYLCDGIKCSEVQYRNAQRIARKGQQ